MSQIQGGAKPIQPITSTPSLKRTQSASSLASQTRPVQAPVNAEASQLIRRSSLPNLRQMAPEISSPSSLQSDRGGLEAMQQPPRGLNHFSRELSQTMKRVDQSLKTPEQTKGFWGKVKSALIGGSERGSEAKALASGLKSHGVEGQAQKLNSWGKWEGRVEQGGLAQKLPQAGSSTTAAVVLGIGKGASDGLKLAGAVVGGVASGAQIIVEVAELRQNVRKLDDSMTRKGRANVMVQVATMKPGEIQDNVQKLDTDIAKLKLQLQSKPGWFKSMFTAGPVKTQQKIDLLTAKREVYTQAQANLQAGKPAVSKQGLAVAKQVVDSSFTKFKVARIAKNILGIAAGAIGIAVVVGALASPVGWIAAGVGLAALGAVWTYNKVQSSQREGAVTGAKTELKSVNRQLLNKEIEHKGNQVALKNDPAYQQLNAQKMDVTLKLLRVSPDAAAKEIIGALKAPEDSPQKQEMKYILHQVLGVSETDYQKLSQQADGDQLLTGLIKHGMPLQPKL